MHCCTGGRVYRHVIHALAAKPATRTESAAKTVYPASCDTTGHTSKATHHRRVRPITQRKLDNAGDGLCLKRCH